MNIDRPEKIYPSREDAIADGAREDQLVTGSREALEKLQSKLLAKSKHRRLRVNGRKTVPRG